MPPIATFVLALLLGAAAVSSVASTAQSSVPAEWSRIVEDWETFERTEDPIASGLEGDRAALGRLPEATPEADARRLATLKEFRSRLAAPTLAALPPADAFNHAFLTRIVEERIERAAFDPARLSFSSEGSAGSLLGYLARTTSVRGLEDAEAWLARLEEVPRVYAEATANARRGLQTGFTQPRAVVESALEIAAAEAALTTADDPLLLPLADLPASIPAGEQEALRARARRLIEGGIAQARRDWVTFLKEEYLPRARPGLGIGSLEEGRSYYEFLARSFTTTSMTPDEIHEIGRQEVARIRTEMEREIAAARFTGSFADFLQWLRTDPKFYARSREELLEKASEISKRADDRIAALFRRSLPRLPYGVRPVPREIEDQYTTGRYFLGSMANGVAGGYIVNTGRLDQRPLYELPALTLHEAVPGHHLQIAIAQELDEQPWFRRQAMVTAFVEGWGLYAEFLGNEMGIYRDPYERFGRLSYEMWRACRLVADTGIHYKGWPLEEARACFRDNSALAPHNIETELQRYVSDPGQALAYKIGELRIKALRDKASAALADQFDVREFHDVLLLGGPLPLDMLEDRITEWVKGKR
jgi:uncharacterized protein (DUF885 family)